MSEQPESSPSPKEGHERPIDASMFSPSALHEIDACLRLLAEATAENVEEIPSPKRLGRYEIRQVLGHGGFGVVYGAYDPGLRRLVALKIPRSEILASREHKARFIREGRMLAALDHPGIVPVYEAGEENGLTYIATGFCDGPTLADWLRTRGQPVPPRQAALWMIAIADAVEHAHSRGILHRDLKPTNILLVPNSDETSKDFPFDPLVSDFGLAKQLTDDLGLTAHDGLVGTPPYLAPEQALRRPKDITVRTDVYSLGAILYEMLTGQPPFPETADVESIRQIIDDPPIPFQRSRTRTPRDLEIISLKCLEKEPMRRYASAAELAADLRRFLTGEPILAQTTSRWIKVIRWCRRKPYIAAVTGMLITSIVAGIAGVFWQWQRAELYANAVEQSLVQAEQGLVNVSWIVEEMNHWTSNADPFFTGNGDQLSRYYERMLARPAPLRPSGAYLATMESFRARVEELANHPEAAGRYFEQTIQSWAELVRLEPDNDDYRQALAANLFSYGAHLRRHNQMAHPLAQPYEERVLYDYLLTLELAHGSIIGDFATHLIERGKALARLGQERNAHQQFRLAQGLLGHALLQFPKDAPFKWLMGKSTFYLACSNRRIGPIASAIQQFTDCNIIFEELIASGQVSAECLLYRAEASRLQAACMRDSGQIDHAVTMFETALHFLIRLQQDEGDSSQVLNLLASTSMNLAELYEKQGKRQHSVLNWERFCEYAGKAVLERTAAEAYAEKLPKVLLDLARSDVEHGHDKEAIGRLIFACRVLAYVDPPRDAHAEQRLIWAMCLGLRADIALKSGNYDESLMHHRAAIDVLTINIENRRSQEALVKQAQHHRTAMQELEAAKRR